MNYNERLLQTLIKKADSGSMAHFYRLKLNHPHQEKAFLDNWLYPFLGHILYRDNTAKIERLINHPDLLLIGRVIKESKLTRDKEASYNLDEIKPLTQFASSTPWQSKLRVTVVFDTHRVNTIVANKLLKILEEPAAGNIILFVSVMNDQLLPTIQSRAITLRLASFDKQEGQDFAMKGSDLFEMVSASEADMLADQYLQSLSRETAESPSYKDCNKIIELSKWFSRSKLFRNSYNERLSRLYLFDKSRR